jgi:TRAP-type mannitol/chloroaromatic compound transport system substrate-binding protein
MHSLLDSIKWQPTYKDNNEQTGFTKDGKTYYYLITHEDGYTYILPSFVNRIEK